MRAPTPASALLQQRQHQQLHQRQRQPCRLEQDRMTIAASRNNGSEPSSMDSESPSEGGGILQKAGLTVVLFGVICLFLLAAQLGGQAFQHFFMDNVGFTRKEFVPYSERVRLEAELQAEREKLDAAAAPAVGAGSPRAVESSDKRLLELLPKEQ